MKFVNPKNDVAFKKIFGSEDKTEILISFLNAVLNLTGDKAIQEISILNPYQTPKLTALKTTILDIRATDKRNVSYLVEMQIEHVPGARKRFTYYLAKAYASQLERGDDYPKLNQVLFVGILDFILFGQEEDAAQGKKERKKTAKEWDRYLSRHQILDSETHKQEFTDLEMTFIELPKFNMQAYEVSTILEKWVYFIKHAERLDVIPDHVTEPPLESAYQVADQLGWSKDDWEAYDYRSMKMQDQRGAVQLASQIARDEGRKEGIEEGRKEGLEEGLRQEASSALLRTLTRLLGEPTAEVRAKIDQLDLATLRQAMEIAFDANSLDEFETKISGKRS